MKVYLLYLAPSDDDERSRSCYGHYEQLLGIFSTIENAKKAASKRATPTLYWDCSSRKVISANVSQSEKYLIREEELDKEVSI